METIGAALVIVASFVMLCQIEIASKAGDRTARVEASRRYNPGRCPPCGREADGRISRVYEARIFYFCSPACASRFEESPLKSMARMKDIL